MAWSFVGVSNVVEVTATAHALVTTGIAGTLQAGDLLIACISSRIASTTSITLPSGGEWTLVSEQKTNNILSTTSAAASGMMAYCVRGASNPNLTFTHPVAPAPAIGRIVAYRGGAATAALDTQTSFTTASTLSVSGTGLTTTQVEDLIVAMVAGGQEAAWSSFNATSPAGASGATVATAPTTTWSERADSSTTTSNDTSLAIFDAIKSTVGATGNLTATASLAALHAVIAGAFKILTTADAWNAVDKSATITLSNSDKTATSTSAPAAGVRSTTTHLNETAGKYYVEFKLDNVSAPYPFVGIQRANATITTVTGFTIYVNPQTGDIIQHSVTIGNIGSTLASSDIVCVAWDSGSERIWFRKNNGLWNNNASADPASGTNGLDISVQISAAFALWTVSASTGRIVTLRTESAEFTYYGPSGFTSWMGEALPAAPITGTGTPAAQASSTTGSAGISSSDGSGTPAGQAAALSGLGTVGDAAATGTGVLAADAATVSAAGVSASSGTGVLAAQSSTASGVGAVASVGIGALAAQAATVAGAGLSVSTGSGALQADAAIVAGAGASVSTGTGSLVVGPAEAAGAGTAAAANSGALVAGAATVEGSGVSGSISAGALQATAAAVAGAGLVASIGTGTLVAGPTTLVGEGVVLEEGAVVGTGTLVAGAATLSGEGEVTGEIIQISLGGGRLQFPLPVEGVGYAILPQLEGEAFGLVVVAGSGVANLPRITGTGAGTAGVAGRSAARLSIKATAIGERGQIGAADAVLKGLSVAGDGVAGARGSASGVVRGLSGEAIGRYDDDEAAVIAFLLAA